MLYVIQDTSYPRFTLVAIRGLDWNRDMAPWDNSAAFKKGAPFTGGADNYMRLLVEEIMLEAAKRLSKPPAWWGIAGYSLAGLFALCAVSQADVFSRVGCMSGSLWFPRFEEIQTFYQSKRIDTVFQPNPGNHFVQEIERTAAGIQWLLGRLFKGRDLMCFEFLETNSL